MDNKPTNTLNHIIAILHTINISVVGFDCLKDENMTFLDFGTIMLGPSGIFELCPTLL